MAAETAIVGHGHYSLHAQAVCSQHGEGVEALPKDMDGGYLPSGLGLLASAPKGDADALSASRRPGGGFSFSELSSHFVPLGCADCGLQTAD